MKNVKISVIIPIFNAERYLEECLESVINQTLKDIEIVCVDDGSIDNSCDIVRKYSQQDERVILLHQFHMGAGTARNLAIDTIGGEYMLFLDADDFLLETTVLEKMYYYAKKNASLVCGSYMTRFHAGNYKEEKFLGVEERRNNEGIWVDFTDVESEYFFQAYIFSTTLIKEHSIRFPNYLRYQDPPFLVRVMTFVKKFYLAPVKMYCYRSGYKNRSFSERQLIDILSGMRDVLDMSIEFGYKKIGETVNNRLNRGGDIYRILKGKITVSIEEKLKEIDKLNKKYRYQKLDLLNEKLFSVIVAVYNTENFLPACIESILNQTLINFELILVDDGSTDSSGKICDDYAEKDKRIHVIHKVNGGLISAREAGKKIALGEYITFVDSDDWIEKDNYQRLFFEFSPDFDIIVGEYVQDRDNKHCIIFSMDNACVYTSEEAKLKMFQASIFNWSGCNKLYRAELVRKFPGWSSMNSYGEDTEFNWSMFRIAKKIAYRPVHGYHYRVRNDSMVHQGFKLERLAYLNRIYYIFNEINYHESELKVTVAELVVKFCFRCIDFLIGIDKRPIDKIIDCYDILNNTKPYISKELTVKCNQYMAICLSMIKQNWVTRTIHEKIDYFKFDSIAIYLSIEDSFFNDKLSMRLRNVDYVLSNAVNLQGKLFCNVPICHPSVLDNLCKKPFVIVCGSEYLEIKKILKSYKYEEYVNFVHIDDIRFTIVNCLLSAKMS